MKHNLKITSVLLAMFLATQFIGLYVVGNYMSTTTVNGITQNTTSEELPLGLETPPIESQTDFYSFLISIIIAFVLAITVFFFLVKFKTEFLLRAWFFVVVIIALSVSFLAILPELKYGLLIGVGLATIFSYYKIYHRSMVIQNLTELFIYPGIAAVFVPLLNISTMAALLILISIYDMWAVWQSGIMQKMAKYHIDKLNIFPGFFIPYATSKKQREQIRAMRDLPEEERKKKKVKVNVAILGGGDIVFPIITAGVVMREVGFSTIFGFTLPIASLFVIFGAAAGLSYLFFFAEKKKFYPAMPFITAGIFLAYLLGMLTPFY